MTSPNWLIVWFDSFSEDDLAEIARFTSSKEKLSDNLLGKYLYSDVRGRLAVAFGAFPGMVGLAHVIRFAAVFI